MSNSLPAPLPSVEIVKDSEVPVLLTEIRPSWRSKNLIERVERLLFVDPSSACQRLLNAAIHDLREKVVIAGLDIAHEAAESHKLPPVTKQEDVERYPTAKLIDLAYRMGLIPRPDWRRICRCYEIRRDLEHEDNEYEAGVEDCIYIFKTCIEVVLAKDPVHLLRITDVKEIIEEGIPVTPAEELLADFRHAPSTRQEEILKFLTSISLDDDQSDIVRQNAFSFVRKLAPAVQNPVKLSLAKHFQDKLGRGGLDYAHARVAYALEVLPYLKQAKLTDFFETVYAQMQKVSTGWRGHTEHGELLRSFKEVGGLEFCPEVPRMKILGWLVRTYVGVQGGMTKYGHVRPVFYSDTAEPHIVEIIDNSSQLVADDLRNLSEQPEIKHITRQTAVSRRMESLLDIVETDFAPAM